MSVGLGGGGVNSGSGFTTDTHTTNTQMPQTSSSGTGIIGGLTELANLGVDIWSTYKTIEQAQKNYDLQQKMFKYSKNLQTQMFQREDNAVLRRSMDLQRAGLSKTLAAGSGASAGPVVPVTTPQRNVNYKMPRFDIQKTAMDMITQKATIDKTFAENKYIQMQTEKAEADKLLSLTRNKQADFDYWASVRSGIPSNASTPGKMIKDARGYIGLTYEQAKNSASSIKDAILDKAESLRQKVKARFK